MISNSDRGVTRAVCGGAWLTSSHILGAGWVSYCLGSRLGSGLDLIASSGLSRSLTPITDHPELIAASATLSCFALAWRVAQMRPTSRERSVYPYLPSLLCLYLAVSGAAVERSHVARQGEARLSQRSLTQRPMRGRGVVRAVRRRGDRVSLVIDIFELLSGDTPRASLNTPLELSSRSAPLQVIWRADQLSWTPRSGDQVWALGVLSSIASAPDRGSRGRARGRLFDSRAWWGRRDVLWRGSGAVLLADQARRAPSLIETARVEISRALDRQRYEDASGELKRGAALARGVVLGDRSTLSRDTLKRLNALGLSHLLAVSGLHVGVLALLFGSLLYRLMACVGSPHPTRWRAIGALCGAWSYAALAGSPQSACRAAWMISVWALSRLAWDSTRAHTAVWIAGWMMVWARPSVGCELGLQLSLSATLALCVWAQPTPHLTLARSLIEAERGDRSLMTRLSLKAWRSLCSSARVAWTAWLATSPVLLWHLGELAPLSPLMNMIITPIIALTYIPLTLISCALIPITEAPLSYIVELGSWLISLADLAPHPRSITLNLGRGAASVSALFMCAWAMTSSSRGAAPLHQAARLLLDPRALTEPHGPPHHASALRSARLRLISIASLLGAITLSAYHSSLLGTPRSASVHFLSVGQGDSTLIESGDGRWALFDAGPASAGREVARRLALAGVDRLEWVALSHLHPDHYMGLIEVLESVEVGELITHARAARELVTLSERYREGEREGEREGGWSLLARALKRARIPIKRAVTSPIIWGDLTLDWMLTEAPDHVSENDASLALLIRESRPTSGPWSVLLSGDLEAEGESRLRAAWSARSRGGSLPPLTLWQADHHGSATSTLPETIERLRPRHVIMSLDGAHRFKFPHPQTLRRLKAADVSWSRLDLHGDLSWSSAGLRPQGW